jgi:hypothetical protein
MVVVKKNANIQLKTEIIQIYKLWKIGKEEEAQMINTEKKEVRIGIKEADLEAILMKDTDTDTIIIVLGIFSRIILEITNIKEMKEIEAVAQAGH